MRSAGLIGNAVGAVRCVDINFHEFFSLVKVARQAGSIVLAVFEGHVHHSVVTDAGIELLYVHLVGLGAH
jgi:hypothetical protein